MGGGTMWTAAKAAAFAGYRSIAARRPPTMPSVAVASSTVHVAVEGGSAPVISSTSSEMISAVQRPSWVLDDWEFAEEGSDVVAVLDPKPSVHFSGTVDNSTKVSQVSDLGGSTAILPKTKHVVQAFSLLQGSPEAQSVVASLVSDPNLWDAVLKNDKFMEFCSKHRSVALPMEVDSKSAGESESSKKSSETGDSPNKETSGSSFAFFTDFVQNIKVRVSSTRVRVLEMLSSISGFLQDFMEAFLDRHGATHPKTATSPSVDGFGASFFALAVAVILVILVKRGLFGNLTKFF